MFYIQFLLSDPACGEGDVLRAVERRDRQPVEVHRPGTQFNRHLGAVFGDKDNLRDNFINRAPQVETCLKNRSPLTGCANFKYELPKFGLRRCDTIKL